MTRTDKGKLAAVCAVLAIMLALGVALVSCSADVSAEGIGASRAVADAAGGSVESIDAPEVVSRPTRRKMPLQLSKQRQPSQQMMRRSRLKAMALSTRLLQHRNKQPPSHRTLNRRARANRMPLPRRKAHRRGSGSRTPSRSGSWTRRHGPRAFPSTPLSRSRSATSAVRTSRETLPRMRRLI